LFGYESTGKSILALDFAKSTQKLGGIVLWDDAEGAFTKYWAEANGVDPSMVEVYPENDVEGYSDWQRDMIIYHRAKLTNNEPILLVCDSIAALECLANIDATQTDSKAEMGNRAKAIYKMYRIRNNLYAKYGVCVIMINQVRDKVGASMFEAATTTPGGQSTKFYASQRVGLSGSSMIKGRLVKGEFKEDKTKGHRIGRNIYVKIDKNKVAPPRDNIKTQVYFTNERYGYVGYSRYHGLADILVEKGKLKKKGSYYKLDGESIAQGEDQFINLMMEDKDFRKRMIKASGINTISKTRKVINSISNNLYPVKLKGGEDE
jgi:recombination protein RecA